MTDYEGTDDYQDYYFDSLDNPPTISQMYCDVSSEYKLSSENLDLSCLGEMTRAVWDTLVKNFELYYETREIGGFSEYDFFCLLQSCLNRNADTYERQLEVYNDDIANPILGRTEVVTYNTLDSRQSNNTGSITYGQKSQITENGNDVSHHIEVPASNPEYDTDRSRDKIDYGKSEETQLSGTDSSNGTNNESRGMTGTVKTELSDLGVRPNYEMLNGFLENNKTYIQFFIETFERCFAPRYRRVFF